RIPQRLL
ncbi:hypothetical protein D047_3036B, partial [Vibrio parahaemolyticus VPTS-2010_2]